MGGIRAGGLANADTGGFSKGEFGGVVLLLLPLEEE
jgi:hypothetical protein